MPTRWPSSMRRLRPRPSRSATSAEPSNIAPRSRASWPAAPPRSRLIAPAVSKTERLTNMAKTYVSATINGESSEFLCETQQTLLDVLRDVIGLTGSKEGCASGDCGACSVIMDGRLVCSCLVLGVEAEGKTITTIEGIAQGDHLHPVQQKFLEHAA